MAQTWVNDLCANRQTRSLHNPAPANRRRDPSDPIGVVSHRYRVCALLSGMGRRRRTLHLSAASCHPPAPRSSTLGRHDAKWEQDLCISSTQTVLLDDPCATTYKQFGKICICHIGYVAIYQTGKIDICWSSNIAICQPCSTAICQNMKLKITSSI